MPTDGATALDSTRTSYVWPFPPSLSKSKKTGDRIAATASNDRAWRHFPLVLLADRSAAHRGEVCGSQTQRTAAEAWELMRRTDRLFDIRAGGWWEPVRSAVLRFAGFSVVSNGIPLGGAVQGALGVVDADKDKGEEGTEDMLSMPEKVVIMYISRQSVYRRKLLVDDHAGLVIALTGLVDRKGSSWELNVLEAEKMTKDDEVHVIGRTTVCCDLPIYSSSSLSVLAFMHYSH